MKYFIEEKIKSVFLREYLLKIISIYKWSPPLTDEEIRDREKQRKKKERERKRRGTQCMILSPFKA